MWNPLVPHFPANVEAVFVAPDGDLARLPWAALPGSKPGSVLIEDHAVAVVPDWKHLLVRLMPNLAHAPKDGGLLAVGGIDYGTSGPKDPWSPLSGTDHERQFVQNLGGPSSQSLGGTDALSARLAKELTGHRFVHVATHGFFDQKAYLCLLYTSPSPRD